MRILFICELLSAGGAERVCVDIANELCKRNHVISLLTDLTRTITYIPDSRIELVQIEKKSSNFRFLQFKQLVKIINDFKPDVIISILYAHATVAKLASFFTNNCPVIVSDHNAYERPKDAPMASYQYIDKFYRNYYFDHVTVLTESDRIYLNGKFKNLSVMPNPLTFVPVDKVPEKSKMILAIGRLNVWYTKGFDLLIDAWRKVEREFPDWELCIVGDGEEDAKTFLKDKSAGLSSIQFLPYSKEVLPLYKKASVFVLSSRFEGFGLVLIEAMSQGCACIACDYKGRQADIVEDYFNGLLCEINNAQALALKIKELLSNDSLLKRIQNNSIVSLDKFSIKTIADKWETLLESVIERPRNLFKDKFNFCFRFIQTLFIQTLVHLQYKLKK